MKPNKIIVALSFLGLSSPMAWADNQSSLDVNIPNPVATGSTQAIDARTVWADRYLEDDAPSEYLTPENYTNLLVIGQPTTNINIINGNRKWNQDDIYNLTPRLRVSGVRNIGLTIGDGTQFDLYSNFVRLNPTIAFQINVQNDLTGSGIIELWKNISQGKPLRVKVSPKYTGSFFKSLSKTRELDLVNRGSLVIDNVSLNTANSLLVCVKDNPNLAGKIAVNKKYFDQLPNMIRNKLVHSGIGLAGRQFVITFKPTNQGYLQEVHDYQGQVIHKPMVLTTEQLDLIANKVKSKPIDHKS